MSLKNIKSNTQAQRGFTIVELLIVVVVIAILAAITIVSYTGITNRANQSGAVQSAQTAQAKVEAYAADSTVGTYPQTLAVLTATGNSWTTPASLFTTPVAGGAPAPTSSNGSNTVQYQVCGRLNTGTSPVAAPGSAAAITVVTGYKIVYWNYSASPAAIDNTTYTGGITSGTVTANGSNTYAVGCYATAS